MAHHSYQGVNDYGTQTYRRISRGSHAYCIDGRLPRRQVAEDLSVGFSTLAKCIQRSRSANELPLQSDVDLAKEVERLRKENRLLKEEQDILKKATVR